MKLTIIPADGAVYKDGLSYPDLNLSEAPANVHALQWNNTKGWIEFCEDEDGNKPANESITELPSWVSQALALWETTHTEQTTQELTQETLQDPISQGTQSL